MRRFRCTASLPWRMLAALACMLALTVGRADPAPSPESPTHPVMTQQGDRFFIDEANGFQVEASAASGIVRYTWDENGEPHMTTDGPARKDASSTDIFLRALEIGDPIFVRLWIKHFPSVMKDPIPNHAKETPLSYALTSQRSASFARIPYNVAGVVEVLLQAGADPNQRVFDTPPLHLALWQHNVDVINMLVTHGAGVNALDPYRQTPRFAALRYGRRAVAEYLRAHGGLLLPHATPVQQAAGDGDAAALAKILHDTPAARNATTPDGQYTPLMLAALAGQLPTVTTLLDAGVDVNAAGANGETALYFATATGAPDVAKALLDHGAKPDPVLRGADRDPTPLLTDVYDLYWFPTDDDTTARRLDIARALLAHGASPDTACPCGDGQALHVAVKIDSLPLAEALQQAHATLDTRDAHGRTPLQLAVAGNQKFMVEFLVSHGADVNAKDKDGHDVLSYTAVNSEIYRYLVENGAKLPPPPPTTKPTTKPASKPASKPKKTKK